ncbi:MAG: UvrD-helicase domain-containing protein [Myxococcota bacterium]
MSVPHVRHPEIVRILRGRRHAVVEASAGTGKTYTLEHLVLDRLLEGAALDAILVVTFTEKATREMKRRIRESLARLLAAPPSAPEDGTWRLDDTARQRLQNAWVDFDRAQIFTIHGFCQRVLSDHAFRSGRPFGHTLIEPRRAFGEAFRETLRVLLAQEGSLRRVLLRTLEDLDVEALESQLYAWRREAPYVQPRWDEARFATALDALARTEAFDLRALRGDVAERVRRRLQALVKVARDALSAGTYLDALIEVDRWGAHEVVQGKATRLWITERLEQTRAPVASLVTDLLGAAPPTFGVLVHRLLPRVEARLRERKLRRSEIDFDDMLDLVERALGTNPALVQTLRAQYAHAFVDEFQDTDRVQWSIFRRLFVEGGEGSLTVIGDPKQSIYGFRGADTRTYAEACAELGEPTPLDRCFRATRRLVDSYNPIFEEDFFADGLHYRPVSAESSASLVSDGVESDVNGEVVGHSAALCLWQPVAPETPRVADVRRCLGERIAAEAISLSRRWRFGEAPVKFSDMQVLVRNASEAVPIAAAFDRASVPYVFYKQDGLFETAEARGMLAMLRAVADPHVASAKLRAWMTAFFDVPVESLAAALAAEPDHPWNLRLQRWHRRALRREAGLLNALLRESGLTRRLLMRGKMRALTNYEHLAEVLEGELGASMRLEDAASLLEALIDGRAHPRSGGALQRATDRTDAVQILTMHKSKGLEATVVFVAGGFTRSGARGRFQPVSAYADGERQAWLKPLPAAAERAAREKERAEDGRLLYVALTRAKARLYLPYFGPPPIQAGAAPERTLERINGSYAPLDARLRTLVASGFVDEDRVRFERVPLEFEAPRLERQRTLTAVPQRTSPPPFDDLIEARRGFVVTSYTRMKAGAKKGYVAPVLDEGSAGVVAEEAVAEAAPEPAVEETLPGGAGVGIFLHEVLEELPFEGLDASFDTWRETSAPLFARCARRQGLDESVLEPAARLIYDALIAPHELEAEGTSLSLPKGFSAVRGGVPEMELFYPVPERAHPALGSLGRCTIERGVVRGIVDLVFEHEGRVYALDWKSDRVGDADLRAHVAANYELQRTLYTLGIVRWLKLNAASYERFGGLIYVFRRRPHDGVVFERPTWDEVQRWDEILRSSAEPFGYALV